MQGKEFYPDIPERLGRLGDIASNLWWSWHPPARMLFKLLDRTLWKESGHNPVLTLKQIEPERLRAVARDQVYVDLYDQVLALYEKSVAPVAGVPGRRTEPVAYFSAEYGLHHSLPFYAGGLGFLAGDHIKECSHLGVDVVAVGFMYPDGYVRQRIRGDGWQENLDEPLDRDAAPITRVQNHDGTQLTIQVPFMEPAVYAAIWKVDVGRIPLYLLDTDLERNDPWNRRMAEHLYVGDLEQRLRQEMVLGLGGYQALRALGITPRVIHLNEGHPAFALLEQIREVVEGGLGYEPAVARVKATAIFTTHTPVPAGHDIFPFPLMERYFSACWNCLGLDRDRFLSLGIHPEHPEAGFNMTAFALRMSAHHNAVSRRHGEVAGRMWRSLWPDPPPKEEAMASITNGVHVPTWIEPKMELLFNRYLGPRWLDRHDDPAVWEALVNIPDEELWRTHVWLKYKLFNRMVDRARRLWSGEGASPSRILAGGVMLDPSILTLGFARRFVEYKRADLILHDLERLKRLANDPARPLQIIFAGKAHPADDPGKRLLQKVFNTATDQGMAGRIAFIEGYDELLAQYLVHGVDVWLNTPRPPLEACGTSGMKAALNGVPQLSVLDGWWAEGFNGRNGWAFGGDDGGDNAADAAELYRLLEERVIPLFYDTDDYGVPHGWVALMRDTIKSSAARFSARRMVKEYVARLYEPAMRAGDGQ